jgi:hypothetical protein
MDTISNYVDSVFAQLPNYTRSIGAKERHANENAGKVPAAEIRRQKRARSNQRRHSSITVMLMTSPQFRTYRPHLQKIPKRSLPFTSEQVDEYINHRHHFAWAMATGVFLCIMGPTSLFLGQYLTGDRNAHGGRTSELLDILTLVPLFLFVSAGVALFILYGMKEQQFELEEKRIKLDSATYARLKAEHKAFRPRLAVAVAIGVALCILAPVSLLLSVVLLGEDNGLSLVFPAQLHRNRRLPVYLSTASRTKLTRNCCRSAISQRIRPRKIN